MLRGFMCRGGKQKLIILRLYFKLLNLQNKSILNSYFSSGDQSQSMHVLNFVYNLSSWQRRNETTKPIL